MIFGKTEHAHLTSFFTAPNADREDFDPPCRRGNEKTGFGKTENLRFTSFFTTPNADREKH